MISDEIRRYQMLDEEIEPHGNSPNSTALGHDQPLWLPLVSVISVITASMDIIFEHIITILIPVKHFYSNFKNIKLVCIK